MSEANPLRGEADVTIAGRTITLAATLDGLGRLSVALGRPTMGQFFAWIVGGEIDATRTALRMLAQKASRGGVTIDKPAELRAEVNAALDQMTLNDLPKVQAALQLLLEPLMRTADGKEEGGDATKGNSALTQH